MKNILKNLGCFFALALIFSELCSVNGLNSIDEIKRRGYIKVSTNAEFEPFEYKDGDKIVGIDVDIAKKIAESLDVSTDINDVSFDAVTLELSSGNCDLAIAAMSYSDDKAENVDFSDTYYFAKQAILVPENSNITSGEQLNGKKLGVALGFTGDSYCTENFLDSEIIR